MTFSSRDLQIEPEELRRDSIIVFCFMIFFNSAINQGKDSPKQRTVSIRIFFPYSKWGGKNEKHLETDKNLLREDNLKFSLLQQKASIASGQSKCSDFLFSSSPHFLFVQINLIWFLADPRGEKERVTCFLSFNPSLFSSFYDLVKESNKCSCWKGCN